MADKIFSVRKAPWEELTPDEKPTTIEDALNLTGLNWYVDQKPAYYLVDPRAEEDDEVLFQVEPVPNYFVNVRSDSGVPLGIVTKRYSPWANIEAFAWLAHVFGSEMHFVAGGELMGGRRVFVQMEIPSFIEVGGDPIGQLAFVHTSHDGKHSVTASMTPNRWLCKNLVNMDLWKARNEEHRARRTIAIRHVGNMEEKFAKMEAERVFDFTTNYYKKFKLLGDQLALAKPSTKDQSAYLEALLPADDEQGDLHRRRREEARQQIQLIFEGKGSDGDSQGNAPGSWWAMYNAAVEFADYYRNERKQGGRFQRAIDDPDGFKSSAFELALGGAGL